VAWAGTVEMVGVAGVVEVELVSGTVTRRDAFPVGGIVEVEEMGGLVDLIGLQGTLEEL